MIKIVWLTPYNIYKLLPEVVVNRNAGSHSSSWIHSLSDMLAQNKELELHIITHTQLIDNTQHFEKNGIHFHIIKYNFPFTKKGFPWYFPLDKLTGYHSFSRKAKKLIEELQPDILHVHGTEGGYFTPAFKTNIPCIISIQGIISVITKLDPTIGGYLQLPYERNAIKKGKYFGCRTNFDFDYVKKKNKNAVIFDLPEAMNMVFYEHHWKPKEGLSLLFIGSVIKRKGIEDLIAAVHKLKYSFPEIKLRIIGSGPKKYIKYIKKEIESKDLQSHITFLGTKSPWEVAAELEQCNFFVLPSYIENSPNSLAEAMAVGVPSIATKVGGIPSMIEDKFDGMLFEKNNVDELVNIIQLLANDKDLQNKLSINAREKAYLENYPPHVAKKYVNVYKSLTNETA